MTANPCAELAPIFDGWVLAIGMGISHHLALSRWALIIIISTNGHYWKFLTRINEYIHRKPLFWLFDRISLEKVRRKNVGLDEVYGDWLTPKRTRCLSLHGFHNPKLRAPLVLYGLAAKRLWSLTLVGKWMGSLALVRRLLLGSKSQS